MFQGKKNFRHSRIKPGKKHFQSWLRLSTRLLQCSFKWNICIFVLASNLIQDVLSSVCNTSITVQCVVWWNERKYKDGECIANCQLHRCRVEFVLPGTASLAEGWGGFSSSSFASPNTPSTHTHIHTHIDTHFFAEQQTIFSKRFQFVTIKFCLLSNKQEERIWVK